MSIQKKTGILKSDKNDDALNYIKIKSSKVIAVK